MHYGTWHDKIGKPTMRCIITATSPPHSHLGRVHRYPHARECTLPLHVLAVICTTHNNALHKRCASLLQDAKKGYGVLQSVMEHYGALRDVTGCYRSVADHYGSVTSFYGTLRKISILPITNWNSLTQVVPDKIHRAVKRFCVCAHH